ncbi:J domain-containing protein [Spiroplasma endosymbiont of Atherix ibis]|uniref:J domain-containing protein n=1 Tax=Spiroplasma endosymbiont of Atherix ibis TaxID=3066291 RepID=UPI0030D1A0CC
MEKLSKEKLIIFSSENIIKIYNEFSIEIFNLFQNTFIQEIVPATIYKFEKKNYKKLSPDMINDFIDEQFNEFCKRIDKIIQIMQSELYDKQNEYYTKTQNNFNNDNEQKLSKAYKILEVSPLDTDDKIKKAYLKLAKLYHPDKNNTEYAKQKMVEINNAYDIVQKNRKKN